MQSHEKPPTMYDGWIGEDAQSACVIAGYRDIIDSLYYYSFLITFSLIYILSYSLFLYRRIVIPSVVLYKLFFCLFESGKTLVEICKSIIL